MVTTVLPPNDSRNRAAAGQGFDGVVRVSVGGYFGTGVLLYDGHAVLTAAHLFTHGSTAATVSFETVAGTSTLTSSSVTVQPLYDPAQGNNDLALVWLSTPAPLQAERYTLYRSTDELGQTMTMVGYGLNGTGASGEAAATNPPVRMKANNQFEADAALLKKVLGQSISWSPTLGTQLLADFDNGTTGHDALGLLLNLPGLGLGSTEGLIAPGDSGGPAFINGTMMRSLLR